MKINPSQIGKAMEVYKSQRSALNPKKDKIDANKQDKVILSDKAKAFQIALKAMAKNEEIDYAKVERLKKQIEAGEYKINPRQIADKIIDDIKAQKGY